jgi:integrase
MPNDKLLHEVTPVDITDADLRKATSAWYVQGLSPSTINKRLNGLGTMGVDIGKGVRPKTRKSLQWWLRPEARDTMHGMVTLSDEFKDYVMWTTHCGFRVEENLRLRREHFSDDFTEVTVPGTKTATAQASLYLPPVCQRIARKRFEMADMMVKPYGGKGGRMDQPLFGMDYRALREEWDHFRDVLGQHDNPGCTLKALRRTAARYLHIDCKMPLDYVRQYLRHEDVETTIGYLRLTGGLTTKEMKGYLE